MSNLFAGQFSPITGSFQTLTLTNSAAQSLTLTSGTNGVPKYALIQAEGADVRWRDDGTAPTSSSGMLILANAGPVGFVGNLATAQFISTLGSGSTLDVSLYS